MKICFFLSLHIIFYLIFIAPKTSTGNSSYSHYDAQSVDSILLQKDSNEQVEWLLEQSRIQLYTNPNLGLEYAKMALELSLKLKNHKYIIHANLKIANAYIDLGQFSSAWDYIMEAIDIAQKNDDKLLLAYSWRVMGIWYDLHGDLTNALKHYHLALSIYEELENKGGIGSCLNNIGIMHYELGDYLSSIEFYKKAIDIYLELNDKRGLSKAYCNTGNAYERLNDYQTALSYIRKAIKIDEELEDKQGLAANLNNIGLVYFRMGEPDKAILYIRQSLDLCEELNDVYRIITRYSMLSEVYVAKKEYSKAITYGNKALELSKNIGSLSQQLDILKFLITAYSMQGNFINAFELQKNYIALKDSIFDIDKAKEVETIRATYEVEKKQQELDKANALAAKDRTARNAFIVAFMLSIVFAFFMFKGYRTKLVANQLINQQNAQLETANAEILAQRDEVEAQRDMVIVQKEKLEEVYNHINHSLRYAQSIQAAILPSEKVLQQISTDYLIFSKPCELVSGDFFWATAFDEYQVFCMADCTGHGVPGAFMSILGISALNDIVVRYRLSKPSDILSHLRKSVIDTLSQNDPEQLHKDGMDMSLCVFNTRTRELQFAGAKLPLWLISSEPIDAEMEKSSQRMITKNGLHLYEVRGDIMPVGQCPRIKPFANHSFSLKKKTVDIYLITDGFADQISGTNHRKFTSLALKELILENAKKDKKVLLEILEKSFEDWKGDYFQIDDATIIGLKI
jgi:tetratricopeptide (TPR) repeat protein